MCNTQEEKRLAAHYEEFRVLSAEIQQRVDRQEKLTHLSIVIAGVSFTVYGFALRYPSIAGVLLTFPILYWILIWLILRHDTMLYTLVEYLFKHLRPNVNHLLALADHESVWLWERFRYTRHLRSGFRKSVFYRFLAFMRYGVPLFLSIVNFTLFFHIKWSGDLHLQRIDTILVTIDSMLFVLTLILVLYWVSQSPTLVESPDD